MAFVLMIGTLMVGTGAMMLANSQAQQNAVIDSLETSQIKNAADVAKIRVEFLFRDYPRLLLHCPDFWERALTGLSFSNETQEFVDLTRLCQSDEEWEKTKNIILPYARSDDINIENNTFFRLINFTHTDDNKALVTIQAKNEKGASANLQAEVNYEFNYLQGQSPGLWTKQKERIRSEIYGNVWLDNCSLPIRSVRFSEEDYYAKHTQIDFPELPNLSEIINRIPDSHVIKLDKNYKEGTSFPRSIEKKRKFQALYGQKNLLQIEFVESM